MSNTKAPEPQNITEAIQKHRGVQPSERELAIRRNMGTAPSAHAAASSAFRATSTAGVPPPPDFAALVRKKAKGDALAAVIDAIVAKRPFVDSDRKWLADLPEDVLARLAGLSSDQPTGQPSGPPTSAYADTPKDKGKYQGE